MEDRDIHCSITAPYKIDKYEESAYINSLIPDKLMNAKAIYLNYGAAMDMIMQVPRSLNDIDIASKSGSYKLMDKQKLDASHVRENGKLTEINTKIDRI
jgi:hypothetical protein